MGVITAAALVCLAQNAFFEARGDGYESIEAVMDVTMNRVDDYRYPDNVCDVVFEKGAFSWTNDGATDDPNKYNPEVWLEIQSLASAYVEDPDQPLSRVQATHYYKQGTKVPKWATVFHEVGQVGSHLFYQNNTPYK